VQFIASRRETALRQANDAVFTILNKEAANARQAAAEASDRASQANERASTNERETARLRKLAEDERLARIKIEERVAWRRLTPDQRSAIASRLKLFSGQQALLQYNVNDLEADAFALDIASALQSAKWRVSEPQAILKMAEGPVPLGTNPPLEIGVVIVTTQDAASHSACDALLRELIALGFDATKSPRNESRPNSVVFISVEHRPEGAQGEAKLREAKIGKQDK
jgi:hypothetical protein